MMNILKIANRTKPKESIIKEKFLNNQYIKEENKEEIAYYTHTPLEEIYFNDGLSLPWSFFTIDGLNYLLPRILTLIQEELEQGGLLSTSLENFLINMTLEDYKKKLLLNLSKKDLLVVKNILENILYGDNENAIQSIGEHYLFLNLEYIETILNNYSFATESVESST